MIDMRKKTKRIKNYTYSHGRLQSLIHLNDFYRYQHIQISHCYFFQRFLVFLLG